MPKCTDPEVGILLAAYELDALVEEQVEQFELHMMHCPFCLEQVRDFREWAETLANSPRLQESVARAARKQVSRDAGRKPLRKYLWPEIPLLFRPAIALGLVVLLLLPSYFGMRHLTGNNNEIRPAQVIRLLPARSAAQHVFWAGADRDGIISFAVPNSSPEKQYRVVITTDDGTNVMQIDRFSGVNDIGMAELIFPRTHMRAGRYRLTITELTDSTTPASQEYRFRIEP